MVLLDVNLSPDWVEYLQAAGFDTIHWSAVGLSDAQDSEIMAYAQHHSFVVLTQDLDFGTILAATLAHRPSVVQIRAGRVMPSTLGPQVVAALLQLINGPDQAALITVDPERTRLTLLPIRNRG